MGRARGQGAAAAATRRGDEGTYQGFSADPAANDELIEWARRSGGWVPGANGTERPFTARSGARLLWCWRPATGEHAYLNVDTDIVLTDTEAAEHLQDPAMGLGRPRVSPEQARIQARAALAKEMWDDGYYQALNLKHFNPDTALGSRFTTVGSVTDLLERTVSQRGSLRGDDREELLALGADPQALLDNCRYLKVVADGIGGLVSARDLPGAAAVEVVRAKPGAPCSLVVDGQAGKAEFLGTVIVGPNEHHDPADPESPAECVWTAHPGLPAVPATEDVWPEGTDGLTVEQVQRVLGEDTLLQVRQPQAPQPASPPADAFSALLGSGRG